MQRNNKIGERKTWGEIAWQAGANAFNFSNDEGLVIKKSLTMMVALMQKNITVPAKVRRVAYLLK